MKREFKIIPILRVPRFRDNSIWGNHDLSFLSFMSQGGGSFGSLGPFWGSGMDRLLVIPRMPKNKATWKSNSCFASNQGDMKFYFFSNK